MQCITIATRKGGAGKSSLASHLSVLAAAGGKPVLLFDCDEQGSLAWWWQLRPGETPALVECEAAKLAPIIATARAQGVGVCIIDTAPHDKVGIDQAMRVADLVVIPTRPGPFDLAAVGATLEIAERIGKPALTVLNACPPRTGAAEPSIVTEAREALTGMGATVARTAIAQRVALSHAIISGSTVGEYEPQGKAAEEMAALWAEIQTHLTGA